MTETRLLIAGIGNVFLGDDGFGVEVVQRLARRALPGGVRVADFGIRGYDLAYALMEDQEATILVDALPRGVAPGTLCVIEPDLDRAVAPDAPGATVEPHSMDPVRVLRLVGVLGGRPKRVLVVGCEPATFGEEEGGQMGLSAPVEAALDDAVRLVESLVADVLAEIGGSARSIPEEVRR